jgi:hypothetical protein
MKAGEIDEGCSTHEEVKKYIYKFGWKAWREDITQKTWRKLEDNIKTEIREIAYADADWVWLRTESCGGIFWTQYWTFGFYNRRGNYWPA